MPGASVSRWIHGDGVASTRSSAATAARTPASGCHSMLRVRAV